MWHAKAKKEAMDLLETSLQGLSSGQAIEKQKKYGANYLKSTGKVTALKIFFSQFKNFLTILLIFASLISFALGETIDAVVIAAIIAINAIFGFLQEYKAEKAIESLNRLATPSCKVIRNNQEQIVPSTELVPGDLLVLEQGDAVPADARIIESFELHVDEAVLTGESIPVSKKESVLPEKTPIQERKNMVFSGTKVTFGRANVLVVATGMGTEFGKIASMIQEKDDKTPLQKTMEKLGKSLGIIAIIICIGVFFVAIFDKLGLIESFELAVSLAVSAAPTGLPVTLTLTLTIGVQRMVRKKALARKLSSVETLGVVDYICTDKTGTVTKNQMTVKKIYIPGKEIDVTGSGYLPKGDFLVENQKIDINSDKQLIALIKTARLCNNAHLLLKDKKYLVIGDPTEGALISLSGKAGLENIEKSNPRVKEIFFDSERKRMSTINRTSEGKYVFTKGAVESVLSICDRIMLGGKTAKMTPKLKREILEKNNDFADSAYRVLAYSYKKYDNSEPESGMVFLGITGMIDPPRDNVKESIETCRKAGISVMMITGDNKHTAIAISKQIGLYDKGKMVLTDNEIGEMTDKELDSKIENIAICARISPQSKVRIVESLKRKGHTVAVIGDGINDAPALKKADIGVSVGSGTDVTKETSEMVLLDDNFATIVAAVEEGRNIYDNIKKFIRLMLSANFDEIFLILTALSFGLPLPMLPLQILFLNLLSDGFPAIALGAEPIDEDLMNEKPRSQNENMIKSVLPYCIFVGLIAFFLQIFLFLDELVAYPDFGRTLIFASTITFELFLVFSVRTEKLFFRAKQNKYVIAAVIFSFAALLCIMYIPFLADIFNLVPLNFFDISFVIIANVLAFVIIEIAKPYLEHHIKRFSVKQQHK